VLGRAPREPARARRSPPEPDRDSQYPAEVVSDSDEIGEPSVVLSSYLRDINICMFVLLATLALRDYFAI
jgi:hypothetical protein